MVAISAREACAQRVFTITPAPLHATPWARLPRPRISARLAAEEDAAVADRACAIVAMRAVVTTMQKGRSLLLRSHLFLPTRGAAVTRGLHIALLRLSRRMAFLSVRNGGRSNGCHEDEGANKRFHADLHKRGAAEISPRRLKNANTRTRSPLLQWAAASAFAYVDSQPPPSTLHKVMRLAAASALLCSRLLCASSNCFCTLSTSRKSTAPAL